MWYFAASEAAEQACMDHTGALVITESSKTIRDFPISYIGRLEPESDKEKLAQRMMLKHG